MVGVRNPDLRSFDSGNSSHGAYITGTPRKYTLASCAVPTLRSLSTSISSLRRYQSLLGATQLVYSALVASYMLGPAKRISFAEPCDWLSEMKNFGASK